MNNKDKNFYKKLTLILIIFAILLRFTLALVHSVSGDACWQLSASRFLSENKKFPLFEPLGRQEPFWAPPFFHIMAAFLYSIFGIFGQNAGELGMKMLSPLFGSLTLVFIYLINKKLFDEKITFYSMLFTAFVPISIDYNVFSYIDGTVAFFVVLSIYFALNDKHIKSSVAAGLAALTKYNGIFVLPLLIYIACKNTKSKKVLIKKLAVIILVPILIASPWLIRNYIDFGNPFWPFFNFVFNASGTDAFENLQTFNAASIFNVNSIIFSYLAIFGVPDGNYQNIFFFNIPHIKLLFALWLLATLFFILPLAGSFSPKNRPKTMFLAAWILSFLAVLVLYIGNAGWTATRFFLPAIPALGMLYGIGMEKINFKSKLMNNLFYLFIFLIVAGFIFSETTKIFLASKEWSRYKQDFEWIKANTNKNDLLIPGDQCLAYYTQRGTLKPASENLKKADYAFVNQKFNLEKRSIIKEDLLGEVKKNNYEKVYENPKTGTSIYKVKQ